MLRTKRLFFTLGRIKQWAEMFLVFFRHGKAWVPVVLLVFCLGVPPHARGAERCGGQRCTQRDELDPKLIYSG